MRIAVSDDAVDHRAQRLRRRVEQHVRRLDERQAGLRILRVRVTSLTPRPSSPNAGISRTVPRSVDTDERGGAVISSEANARSRASIADG